MERLEIEGETAVGDWRELLKDTWGCSVEEFPGRDSSAIWPFLLQIICSHCHVVS